MLGQSANSTIFGPFMGTLAAMNSLILGYTIGPFLAAEHSWTMGLI
jgi:hypothetical protein